MSSDNHKNHNHEHEHDHHHDHDHKHTENACGCDHDHDHEHAGCACEEDILENLNPKQKISKKPIGIFLIGIAIFLVGYLVENYVDGIGPILGQLIFLFIVVFVGKGIIIHGLKSLSKGEIKIEFLVTIATIGAFLLGSGEEGVALILLFYLAEYLEHYALDKSKRSIVKLVSLTPDIGIIKKDNEEIEVEVNHINKDDIVIVKSGDKIPVDGIIIDGHTSVNQSSITGESIPVEKTVGDEVYASTINEEGYIEIKVTKSADDTVFANIIDLIKNSQEKKAKIDIFIDKFTRIYTPIIILLAIIVAFIPPIILSQEISIWVYRALVLLVISCPCALAISTPVSMVSAITSGTKNGIIIKGGEYIEELADIKAILFDKTGTLTEGNLEINEIISSKDYDKDELIKLSCSLESKSKHPIAKAFNKYGKNNSIELYDVDNFKSLAGKGLVGEINGKKYTIGKKSLFDNIPDDLNSFSDAKTTVYLGTDEKIIGYINLTDKIRSESKYTIEKLKKHNITSIMITGDNEEAAKSVSNKIGLDEYYYNLLPEDKVNKVQELVDKFGDVAMIGDGVNDTPSLARANVGIAMGLGGADVAIETGDIVLLEDNLSKIDLLIRLAKKTMNVIKENVVVCVSIKGILAVLGILGFITLWEAVLIGDMGLTLLVVANALRLSKHT